MLTKAAPIVNMYSLTEYTDCAAEPELWHLNSATTTEYELRSTTEFIAGIGAGQTLLTIPWGQ